MDGKKAAHSNREDRISDLPDNLIHSILSFIDMKYAVQTSVLSKRWQHIWRDLPFLNFDAYPVYHKCMRLLNMVHWFRDPSCIQRFHLDCRHHSIPALDIYACIAKAVIHNVEELIIKNSSWGDPTFIFSHSLCTCKTLTKLELELLGGYSSGRPSCLIVLPTYVSLPRLKSMSLRFNYISFKDENLANNLFTRCPALESLVLESTGYLNLNITLPKLKNFSLRSFPGDSKVTLCAPNLTSFICYVNLLGDYCLESLSCLITADVRIYICENNKVKKIELHEAKKVSYAKRMVNLMRGLYNVKVLQLTSDFRVLSGASENLDCQLPEFPNLQRLVLTTWLSRDCVDAIIYLLEKSPNIEFLTLTMETKIFSAKDFQSLGSSFPFMLYHLKHIEIRGLKGYVHELKFINMLLKSAVALEKAVLFSHSCRQDSQGKSRMEKFKAKLLAYTRFSTSIILFEF